MLSPYHKAGMRGKAKRVDRKQKKPLFQRILRDCPSARRDWAGGSSKDLQGKYAGAVLDMWAEYAKTSQEPRRPSGAEFPPCPRPFCHQFFVRPAMTGLLP